MTTSYTTLEKFNAAVHVIQNLPKNGPFQPSNDMKLRFYSHFKQATEGPCADPKPAFWEVVKKAKWDAWTRLGDMSKDDAMNNYIEDLKKVTLQIIETMPYTENAADFSEKLGSFYEMVDIPIARIKEERSRAYNKSKDAENEDASDHHNIKENGLSNGISKSLSVYRQSDWTEMPNRLPAHVLPLGMRDAQSEKFYSGTESDDDEFSDPLQGEGFEDKPKDTLVWDVVENDSGYSDATIGNGQHVVTDDKKSHLLTGFLPFRASQKNGASENIAPIVNGSINGNNSGVETVTGNKLGHVMSNGVAHKWKLSNNPIDGVARRGGGDPTATGSSSRTHRNSERSLPSQTGKAHSSGSFESMALASHLHGMGSGGGQRRGPGGNRASNDVNEQIAETLFQLQKDMESVLTRLNTLEALTVAHHNIARGRITSMVPADTDSSTLPKWWPFRNMPFKTVVIFLAWPAVLHLLINLILAHRARRALRKYRRV